MNELYIGTNTKMYKNRAETVEYIRALRKEFPTLLPGLTLFVIPSFTSLESAQRELFESPILLGAQNMCWEEAGAYTGEISPRMLKEAGVGLVEIGHCERRRIFGETDEQENRKVLCALRNRFKALLCIGETLEQKERGESEEVLASQLEKGLAGVSWEQAGELMIAYEPVWAIGEKGMRPQAGYVSRRHEGIRKTLRGLFGRAGDAIPVLYGGSVDARNAPELIRLPGVDGLFVGRSAWEAVSFAQMIREVYDCHVKCTVGNK